MHTSQKSGAPRASDKPGAMRSNRRKSPAGTGTWVSLRRRSTLRSGIAPPASISTCLRAVTMAVRRALRRAP
eukprot:4786746-Pyramimonas_sp.AAC.1